MPNTPVRNVRLDDDLWQRVNDAAEQHNLNISEWLRNAINAALMRQEEQ